MTFGSLGGTLRLLAWSRTDAFLAYYVASTFFLSVATRLIEQLGWRQALVVLAGFLAVTTCSSGGNRVACRWP